MDVPITGTTGMKTGDLTSVTALPPAWYGTTIAHHAGTRVGPDRRRTDRYAETSSAGVALSELPEGKIRRRPAIGSHHPLIR